MGILREAKSTVSPSLGYSHSRKKIDAALGHGNWGEFNEWLFANVLAGVREPLRDSEAPGDNNIEEPYPPLTLKGLKEGAVPGTQSKLLQ